MDLEDSKQDLEDRKEALDAMAEALWRPTKTPKGQDIGFSVLELPQSYLSDPSVITDIELSLAEKSGDAPILFVLSQAEYELAEEDGVTQGFNASTGLAPAIMTYSEAFKLLENNRSASVPSAAGWKKAVQPAGWQDDRILPHKMTVVISLDPFMRPECAMAIVGLVHWAFNVSAQPGAAIRVVTMAPGPRCTPFHHLVFQYAPNLEWGYCCLPGIKDAIYRLKDRCKMVFSSSMEDTIADLHERITSAQLGTTHAVVCFPGWEPIKSLEEMVNAEGTAILTIHLIHRWTDLRGAREILHIDDNRDAEDCPPRGRLIYMENSQRLPVDLKGFSHAYFLFWDWESRLAFDGPNAQVTKLDFRSSMSERLDQMSWGYHDVPRTSCYISHPDLEAFQNQMELSAPRAEIEGVSAGGVIAAIFRLGAWGVDVPRTIRSLLKFPQVTATMTERLRVQRIIDKTGSSLIMPPGQEAIFMATLPHVGYDHRLAHLVALPSCSVRVLRVKIQLAALISIGIEQIVRFPHPESTELAPRKRLIDACQGWGQQLSSTGTMWIAMGLWKHIATFFREFHIEERPKVFQVPGCEAKVNVFQAFRVYTIVDAIINTLDALKIQVDMRQISQEKDDLTAQEILELQRHLLEAFIHQLTLSFPASGQSTGGAVRHQIISTVTNLTLQDMGVADTERILKENGSIGIYGICQDLETTLDDQVLAHDWTWIPTHVVDEWKRVNAPDVNLPSALSTGHARVGRAIDRRL